MSYSLCLGTAQLGNNYGATNRNGILKGNEARKILQLAADSGIELIDTASSYGESERLIGRYWPMAKSKKVITKLSGGDCKQWSTALDNSLKLLNIDNLEAVLVHRPKDLSGSQGNKMMDWLQGMKAEGHTKRVGVSIYNQRDLDEIDLDRIDIVQMPISLYDQRMMKNETLDRLRDNGIAIHARSVFLQGLILERSDKWPKFISEEFRCHHERIYSATKEEGKTMLQMTLSYLASINRIEAVLVGVQTRDELKEIVNLWNKKKEIEKIEASYYEWNNERDLDPRHWKR